MAGDEDKKVKKKKVKKTEKAVEEAAPAPEPEPAPAPEPEPAPAEDPAQEEAPPAGEGEEGVVLGEDGEVMAEAPPAPKKKPKFFIHWNRRKPKFYDYNFDYGSNYYSSVVNYIDHKNLECLSGSIDDIPRRKAFAERGIDSSVVRKSQPDLVTQSLVNSARNSIRGYENFQREYGYDVDKKYFV
ncbi:UNVERIFIED_CONTAM: hypothetical protein GTU68_002395 [Idotea baltica]|nr:hypothetical protein [Idotea baltica]